MAALLAMSTGAAVAGCATPTTSPLTVEAPGRPVQPDAERLEEALDRLGKVLVLGASGADTPDGFLEEALRAYGLTPPLGGRFRFGPEEAPIVAALIPGGRPDRRDTLVVALAQGRTESAALLEAARLINARASFTPSPGRSVLVAFPLGQERGDAALARVLALPLWQAAAVRHVVYAGPDTAAVRRAAADRGLLFTGALAASPIVSARPDPTERKVAVASLLTLTLYEQVLAAARPPLPPIVTILPPDTLVVPDTLRLPDALRVADSLLAPPAP